MITGSSIEANINASLIAAINAYDIREIGNLVKEHGKVLTPKNKGQLLIKMAGYCRLMDPQRRLDIVKCLLSEYGDEISREDKIQGFIAAARESINILRLFNLYCAEILLDDAVINEAFLNAQDAHHFGMIQYLLQTFGKRLYAKGKESALIKVASYFKIIDQPLRLEIVKELLSEYSDEMSIEAKMLSFKGALRQGDMSLLELLNPLCREKISVQEINDFFTIAGLPFEKNLYLLQEYGKRIAPQNKAMILTATAGFCRSLDQDLRLAIVERLLDCYGIELGIEDKLLALKAAEKVGAIEMVALFKKHCPELFPPNDLIFSSSEEKPAELVATIGAKQSIKPCNI